MQGKAFGQIRGRFLEPCLYGQSISISALVALLGPLGDVLVGKGVVIIGFSAFSVLLRPGA